MFRLDAVQTAAAQTAAILSILPDDVLIELDIVGTRAGSKLVRLIGTVGDLSQIAICYQIASTINMIRREKDHLTGRSVEQIVDWIVANGGVGRLHFEWMKIRCAEVHAAKESAVGFSDAGFNARYF